MKVYTEEDKNIILSVLRTLQRKNKQKKTYFTSGQLLIFFGLNKGFATSRWNKEGLDSFLRKNHMHGIRIQPITIGRVCSSLNDQKILGSLGRETRRTTWELTDDIFKELIEEK